MPAFTGYTTRTPGYHLFGREGVQSSPPPFSPFSSPIAAARKRALISGSPMDRPIIGASKKPVQPPPTMNINRKPSPIHYSPSGVTPAFKSSFKSRLPLAAIGGATLGAASFVLAMAEAGTALSRQRNVTTRMQAPRIGQAGSRYNLGVDPIAGVRFGTMRRRFGAA